MPDESACGRKSSLQWPRGWSAPIGTSGGAAVCGQCGCDLTPGRCSQDWTKRTVSVRFWQKIQTLLRWRDDTLTQWPSNLEKARSTDLPWSCNEVGNSARRMLLFPLLRFVEIQHPPDRRNGGNCYRYSMVLAGKPILQNAQVSPRRVGSLGYDHMDMRIGRLEVG